MKIQYVTSQFQISENISIWSQTKTGSKMKLTTIFKQHNHHIENISYHCTLIRSLTKNKKMVRNLDSLFVVRTDGIYRSFMTFKRILPASRHSIPYLSFMSQYRQGMHLFKMMRILRPFLKIENSNIVITLIVLSSPHVIIQSCLLG